MRPGRKKIFLENFRSIFLLSRRRFCVFNICCVEEQTRNYLGNTEETLTLNVSRIFPRLRTQGTYLEDAEFASRKQKCFASFPFAHPNNVVSNIDSKCFCRNASSFAPTFTFYTISNLNLKSPFVAEELIIEIISFILVREPNSENCSDLIFAAPPCEKVIIVPDRYKLHPICNQKIHVGYAKSWYLPKHSLFNISTTGLRACEAMCITSGKN